MSVGLKGRALLPVGALVVSAAALAALIAVVYGFYPGLGPGGRGETGIRLAEPKSVAADAAVSRTVSFPSRAEVPVAAITAASPDPANADQPAIADVGAPDAVTPDAVSPGAVTPDAVSLDRVSPAKSDENQSDAEIINALPEPIHPVAPVPTQDGSAAALNVGLASITATARRSLPAIARVQTLVAKSAAHSAFVTRSTSRPARAQIGDVSNQLKVANGQQRMVIPVASFVLPSVASNDAISRGWPLVDESPIPDPPSLLVHLAPDDPLQMLARVWMLDEVRRSSISVTPTLQALSDAIARSRATWQTLYEMGRVSAFLDVQSSQQEFWRAAVLRSRALSQGRPAAQRDLRSMEVLAGTFLWVWKDDDLAASALRTLLESKKLSGARAGQAALLLANVLEKPRDGAEP